MTHASLIVNTSTSIRPRRNFLAFAAGLVASVFAGVNASASTEARATAPIGNLTAPRPNLDERRLGQGPSHRPHRKWPFNGKNRSQRRSLMAAFHG